jgi:GntR family transcriptional regulator
MVAPDSTPLRVSTVDHTSPLPYYAQVKEALRESIERGDWKPGQQIPGESELCVLFGVSRTVVRQALTELVFEGLIVRAKGKGTFVAESKITENLAQKLTGFYEDMANRGLATVSRVLKQQISPASTRIAGYLEIPTGTSVIEIERLRFVQDEPLVLVSTYIPYARCPALLQADLSRQSLYVLMEREHGIVITRGKRAFEAVAATQREADLLRVERGAPLMLLDSVSCTDDGTPIEYFHALHRGDRSRFEADLLRMRDPAP